MLVLVRLIATVDLPSFLVGCNSIVRDGENDTRHSTAGDGLYIALPSFNLIVFRQKSPIFYKWVMNAVRWG